MNKNTSISLGEHLEQFVSVQIDSGRFSTRSEVVRAGLRLLERESAAIEALRTALEEGEQSGFIEGFDPEVFKSTLKGKGKH